MLAMRGQVAAPSVKMGRPPPVPPRPDKGLVADALARSRKVPAPVLPLSLKKETTGAEAPPTDKSPSPKLNGLSRVKSFIRDVINDKKHDKPPSPQPKDDPKKSGIPVSLKAKVSMNHPTEESVKNQSSQSVVRSLCSVLMNSDKPKSQEAETPVREKVKIVKSNSFVEKAVPVRRAPPPPISPKPSKKLIEERLGRYQKQTENVSLRKLSASCEELNNSSRPVVYQSNKTPSPPVQKKLPPPSIPLGKPSIFRKKSSTGSPTKPMAPSPYIIDPKQISPKTNGFDLDDDVFKESDDKREIAEVVSAKNEVLLAAMSENAEVVNAEHVYKHAEDNADKVHDVDCKPPDDNVVNFISYSSSPKMPCENGSVCSSESGSGGGKTVLFINSDSFSKQPNVVTNGKTRDNASPLGDISNHELLIYELQKMKRDADEERITKRQRKPSSELSYSSPDSVNGDTQNIQHSDWLHVENDGNKVVYTSCQIVIEDKFPVDDSGICLSDNLHSPDDVSPCLSPTLISRLKEQFSANQKMSSLQGLPPLPKSLSGFNVGDENSDSVPPPVPARGPNSLRYASVPLGSPPTPIGATLNGGSSSSSSERSRKPTTLDTQLAVLKREMLSLRQLDLSLLSQLWSLNESIHEFRQYMNDRSSSLGAPEDDDDMDDEGDDSSSGGEEVSHSHRGRTPV